MGPAAKAPGKRLLLRVLGGCSGPVTGLSARLKCSELLSTVFAPRSPGSKTTALTRLGILLLCISCQGETVVAVAVLNESDGNGDQLLKKISNSVIKRKEERSVKNSVCFVIMQPSDGGYRTHRSKYNLDLDQEHHCNLATFSESQRVKNSSIFL